MMTSTEIRRTFLGFFASKQHQIVPSAPMVVKNDPTLMFTNAGMNQFKDWFLGNEPVKWPRVTDSQKCLRVSGKHNDLEEVGHDTYHHTMFEMLGNWSFGDYFKEEAIAWAWELLTEVYKIDKNKLYVTIFGGDAADNMAEDTEALEIWKKYIAEDRILRGSKKDNFWEMGDTGPCGPCSEIHVDIRGEAEKALISGDKLVNNDHPQVIEIWNNVFIQYNRQANGTLVSLPAKHVDTGMGFERLCMVLQGKQSNYDTDVFTPLLAEIAKITGITYGSNQKSDVAMRVIADHLRAVTFAIADGQLPSNVKAGYVIRRILRRAVRYAYSFLNMREPLMYKLVTVLEAQMGESFPELSRNLQLIQRVIHEEEASFLRTLATGIVKFNQYIASHPGQKVINGEFAFEMYDTFGFPIDLTQLMSRELGWDVDMENFSIKLEEQKNRSRRDATVSTDDWHELVASENTEFLAFDTTEADVKITRYRKITAKGKDVFQLVLDRTPFYAESGGQTGDTGTLVSANEILQVMDTRKENNLIVHIVENLPENPGSAFRASVDLDRRTATANNHSATHLLHYSMRKVLGTHVEQKGSFVGPDYLRFDFSHFQKLTDDELLAIEKMTNSLVRANTPLDEKRSIGMDEAVNMGALAFFGEKYGDKVRVIRYGNSVELCGGTHVRATGQIGMVKIVSEGAIASGIRRIEAITAAKAEEYVYEQESIISNLKQLVKSPTEPIKAVQQLIDQNSEMRKMVETFNHEKALRLKDELVSKVEQINGINFLAVRVNADASAAKDIAFGMRATIKNLFLVLGSENDGKATLSVLVSDELIAFKGLNAGNIVRELAKSIQGGGGGQPGFATAGGKNPLGLDEALKLARNYVA
jgi:alanyl-tRNA synthetase